MNNTYRSSAEFPTAATRSARPTRVVIADDECMFRASLRQLLAVPPSVVKDVYGVEVGHGFEVVGEAGSGQETVETVRSAQPDLLLLDISMPRSNGLEALRELRPNLERTRTIILSASLEQAQLVTAIRLGARGVVPKVSATELLFDAMMRVMAGEPWLGQALVSELMDVVRVLADRDSATARGPFGLTPREREVLTLVVEGCANKEIAQRFAVSEETIKHHLTRMFDKVGAANRLELAMTATRNGLVN